MKKELLIAVFIGLSFGLLITYGAYRATTAITQPKIVELSTPTPAATPPETGIITLTNPQDESIQADKAITIVGTTKPGSFVVVVLANKELITTADSTGAFSISGELTTGANVIPITAIDEDGASFTLFRTVIVSSDSLEVATAASASPTPSATASASPSSKPR